MRISASKHLASITHIDCKLDERFARNPLNRDLCWEAETDAEYGAAGRQLGKEKKLTSKHSIP